jgi:hypothetical protein
MPVLIQKDYQFETPISQCSTRAGGTIDPLAIAKKQCAGIRDPPETKQEKEEEKAGDFFGNRCVSELLAYNFKQFGGLIKVVPRIFADDECKIRDLGQLIARGYFWLFGLRGKEKARKATLHNRFVEVFVRCWHEKWRGQAMLDIEKNREGGLADIDFLISQIEQLLQWAEVQNEAIHDVDSKLHLYLASTLHAMVDAKNSVGCYNSATPPARAGSREGGPFRNESSQDLGERSEPTTTHMHVPSRWPSEEFCGADDPAVKVVLDWLLETPHQDPAWRRLWPESVA